MAPLTASLFSILALSWIRRRVNAKPGSAPSPCPPLPACPCQPLLGSGALPPSLCPPWGCVPAFCPLPTPPALLHSLPCIPTRREVTSSARPRRAGGEGAAGRPPRLSVLSAIPWCVAGTGPQPLPPATAPQPCPAGTRLWDVLGTKGSPRCSPPPAAQVPWGPRAPSPIYIYKYNPRNKPETTRDQRCVLPGGTGQSSRGPPVTASRPASLARSIATRASPLPAQPSSPSAHPSSVRPSLLPAWRPGAPLQCGTSQGQAIVPPPVPCCRWEMLLSEPTCSDKDHTGLGTSGRDRGVGMAGGCPLGVELETPSGGHPSS